MKLKLKFLFHPPIKATQFKSTAVNVRVCRYVCKYTYVYTKKCVQRTANVAWQAFIIFTMNIYRHPSLGCQYPLLFRDMRMYTTFMYLKLYTYIYIIYIYFYNAPLLWPSSGSRYTLPPRYFHHYHHHHQQMWP